jgi:hypothetical protein
MRAFYLALIFVSAGGTAVLDRVAVAVGDEVITESEVQEELRLDEFMSSQPLDVGPAQRRTAADHLVDQQLIRHEMETSHYATPKVNESDAMLKTLRERFHSEAEYRSALQKYGITEEQIKQHLQWQLTVLRFTDERFGASIQQPADRAAPGAPPPVPQSPPAAQNSAERIAPEAAPQPGETTVDQQMDDWLKEARRSTHIEFKKEAFQ